MKKKSCHRRRTKVVRRSRKNSRRTFKRKSLGKGRRRPTRRYSRVQRGGLPEETADTSLPRCVTIDDFKKFYDSAIRRLYNDEISVDLYLSSEKKEEFDDWMKSEKTVHISSMSTYSSTVDYPYPVSIVSNILRQILSTDKKLCQESIDIIRSKIQWFPYVDEKLYLLTERNYTSMKTP